MENLLEYYLQRCETVHSEAERLLENTRDLEDSITVSLSARRFEVNKLELMLSIATFATAVGALVAGIFGMNLRNRFEMSVARAVPPRRCLPLAPPVARTRGGSAWRATACGGGVLRARGWWGACAASEAARGGGAPRRRSWRFTGRREASSWACWPCS